MRRGSALALGLTLAAVLAACGGDSNDAQTTGSTGSTGATAGPTAATASGPTAATSSGPSGATATGATGSTGATGAAAELEDGRHFGWITEIDPTGSLTFDLAYFYTGDEANEIAAERGDETPVPNDYYIVNDNPKLRDLDVAFDPEISVFDWNRCCDERVTVGIATFADVMSNPDGFVEDDGRLYYGQASPYWVTVADGAVTEIEEQYLP
jgi:hypothetical protein